MYLHYQGNRNLIIKASLLQQDKFPLNGVIHLLKYKKLLYHLLDTNNIESSQNSAHFFRFS